MDPKVEELNATRGLIRLHNVLAGSHREMFAETPAGRRAALRIDEALIDCLRKAITDLRPALLESVDADLTRCEETIARRKKELGVPA